MLLKIALIYWALVSQFRSGISYVVEKGSRLNAMDFPAYCADATNSPPGKHTLCIFYNEKINKRNRRRGSIFASAPKFRLPSTDRKRQNDTLFKIKNTTENSNQSKEILESYVKQHNNKIKQKANSHQINVGITKTSHEVESRNTNETPEEYNIPIDIFDENLHTSDDDKDKEHETKNNVHEHVNGTSSKLMKLLDQVEEEIQNTQIASSEKAAIHEKIKKIIDNVGSKPKESTDRMPDSKENSKILPEDGKTHLPLLFNTGMSEGEFNVKKSDENEKETLFPTQSHEFDDYKELRPTYKYRDEISIANSDKYESEPYKEDQEVFSYFHNKGLSAFNTKDDKHSNYYPEDTKLLSNKFYHRDKYTKYDTETDFDTDLLDDERQKFYQKKLKELENRHLYPNNDEYQQRGEDMEHIQSDKAEPVKPRNHLQDEEERHAASRFYKHYY